MAAVAPNAMIQMRRFFPTIAAELSRSAITQMKLERCRKKAGVAHYLPDAQQWRGVESRSWGDALNANLHTKVLRVGNSQHRPKLMFSAAGDSMDLCNEFQNYADECGRIAAASNDPNARAAWQELAERWARAAKTQMQAERQAEELHSSRRPRRRKNQHRWSQAFAQ